MLRAMAISMDLVGKTSDPVSFTYTWKDVILYALGVGAKIDELDFLYEGRGPKVLPTFAVVPSFTSLVDVVGRLNVNLMMVLHGEQAIRLHRPIPPGATLRTRSTIRGIYDKGKGALVAVECNTVDEKGEPVFDNTFSVFVRGEGGFGGERGPETPKHDPPEGKAPDFEVVEAVAPEQALLYRLGGGDLNPLHADPGFAKMAGFEKPIFHGLGTFGFAGRAVLKAACGGDPARLKAFGARFSGPVLPGDTLTTRGWKTDDRRYVVTVSNQAGKAVLTQGTAEIG
jgi:acyl dehydratase